MKRSTRNRWLVALGLVLLLLLVSPLPWGAARAVLMPQKISDFTTKTPLPEADTLIIGFMGGREKWDDAHRGVRKFALHLRAQNLPGVHIETAENMRRDIALELVKKCFDRDQDGTLSEAEARNTRLILFGQSFGGAAVNKFSKDLKPLGVPVLLSIQIDSVGRDDQFVPPNVRRAVNFYQQDDRFGIRGEPELFADDPQKTELLGNHRYDYRHKVVDLSDGRWYQRWFKNAHVKMEQDPDLWAAVEKLIVAELERPRIPAHTASRADSPASRR